jgi:hypothetical protein
VRKLPTVHGAEISLEEAVGVAATGDVWLFRGASVADFAIRTVTNAPVNHVGMVVALDDLPPLLWHAELGRSLEDVWTGQRQRGVQLHLLADAITTWQQRYDQRTWVRQLMGGTLDRGHEDRLMETIARFDGHPFPTMPRLARRWVAGRVRRRRTAALSRRPISTWGCSRSGARRARTTPARSGAATGSSSSRRSGSPARCPFAERLTGPAARWQARVGARRCCAAAQITWPWPCGSSTVPSETAKTTCWRCTAMKSWWVTGSSPVIVVTVASVSAMKSRSGALRRSDRRLR